MMKNAPPSEDFDVRDIEDDPTFGSPLEVITCQVDVRPYLDRKRASMRAHASQISDSHFMLAMPDEAFAPAFGTEWFIRDGQGPGHHRDRHHLRRRPA